MKGFFAYFLTVILLSLLGGSIYWFFHPELFISKSTMLSPLPEFLALSKNHEVSTLDLFLPLIQSLGSNVTKEPQLTAKAVISYDMTTDKTVFVKNPHERLPMASLTKVMTAIVGIENQLDNDTYVVHKQDLVGENVMGLLLDEKHTLSNLLYGLVLLSGNDAAETISSNYPLGRTAFIDAMNNKAKALGLKDTNFTNPSGLEGDGDQHSSAYDLLVITKYALTTYPLFATVAQTVTKDIPPTDTHQEYYLENETNLLTSYPGVKGVKTGYTPEAGLCLITYLDYKGHKIIVVLLGSENRRDEMKQILDYSLLAEGITPPKHE